MEEKTEYKLCPYCKSIYIPTENYCCKHCYEKSFIIRRDVYAQIQSKNKKGSNSIIKLQHDEEFESRKELLSIWKKYGFVGFLHTTNFNNFIDIYKSKFLKSRNQLKNEGLVFEDNAELSVLSHTDELTKSKVRLYYRCKTPTNISAFKKHNQQRPVMIVFTEDLLLDTNLIFCDGGAGTYSTKRTQIAKEALSFNWKEIFASYSYNDDNNNATERNHRNAEVLINSPLSLENAIKFYFRNKDDYNQACKILGKDARFEYAPSYFI